MLLTDELVGAVAGLAGLAVEQGIGEAGHMAGRDPGLGVHDDGGVKAHVIGALLNELFEPGLLDVVFELNAEGTVVPGVGKSAVDLAAGVHEAAVFAQCNDLVHGFFAFFHFYILSRDWRAPEINLADKVTILYIYLQIINISCKALFYKTMTKVKQHNGPICRRRELLDASVNESLKIFNEKH